MKFESRQQCVYHWKIHFPRVFGPSILSLKKTKHPLQLFFLKVKIKIQIRNFSRHNISFAMNVLLQNCMARFQTIKNEESLDLHLSQRKTVI